MRLEASWPTGQPKKLSAKVMDISAFLATAEGWDDVKLEPLPHKIAVHEPCSLRNVLRGSTHAVYIAGAHPGAQVVPLGGK